MTVANAIKKLSKYGTVKVDDTKKHYIHYRGYEVSFRPNGALTPDASITCEHTRQIGEESDINSDYFAGSYWNNLTQALKYVEQYGELQMAGV
jgi:hypothetical protein